MSPSALRTASLGLAILMAGGCTATPPEPTPRPSHWWDEANTGGDFEEDSEEESEEDSPEEQAAICVRKATRLRTADQPCDDELKGYAWYYVPLTAKIPAVGKKAKSGSFSIPSAETSRASKKGGKGSDVLIYDDRDRVEVCVRNRTRIRVSDDRCDDEEKDFRWYYLLLKSQVPAVGEKAANGSFQLSLYAESFRARRGGGKGRRIVIRPRDDEDEPTVTTTQPTPTRTKSCTTIRSKRGSTTRCS